MTGNPRWADFNDGSHRQVVWQASDFIFDQTDQADVSFISPRFADGGTTLYFARRAASGQADIYRSQLIHGAWTTGDPVTSLNTPSDDIGAVATSDGRQLFLYSNRPGGLGGFDVYVSHWQDNDWTKPVNVGAQINTTADEYDPAISPDGRSLYYASNRLHDAVGRDEHNNGADQWSGTLRHRESNTFDLYVSTRDGLEEPWKSMAPLDDINRPDSNEGAPFVASNGVFLYFASDRPVRPGEKPNLDLFRTNIIDGRWTESVAASLASETRATLENLGPEINTHRDETEPALSPEGFTLVYSGKRDGRERLLLSRAEEVRFETAWDTSNLSMIGAVWLRALLITLAMLLMAAMIFASRGRFAKAATSAQFFAGSVMFHVLLLFVLALWNLPRVMEVITSKKFEAEASTQIFDDNQHQSHEDGQAAYEKLADLQSLENVQQTNIVRQETEAFSVPERTDNPLPTIPMDVARRLPAERLMFVPPQRDEPKRPAVKSASMPTLSRPAPQVAQIDAELANAAVELPVPVETLGERPIATQIDMPRSEQVAQPVQFDIKVPEAQKLKVQSATDLTPPAVEIGLERKSATLPLNPLEMRVAPIPDEIESVVLAEDVVLPAAPVEAVEKISEEPTPLIKVDRVTATTPNPVTFATAGERAITREPQAFAELNALIAVIENRPAESAKAPIMPPREVAPAAMNDPLVGVAEIKNEDVTLAKTESSNDDNMTDPDTDALKLAVDRVESTGPMPLTAREMSGPASQTRQRIIVGALSLERNLAPPSFNELASQLDRPRAKATAVSLATDSVGLRSMFTLRQGDTRKQYIELFGGTEETEKAVNRGLVWITQHQNADGSWSLNHFNENCKGKHPDCNGLGGEASNTAATGLALLPLLAAGNTHVDGEYAKQVAAGLQWLIDHQKPDGELLGPGDQQKMYSQGIAAIALCEAFGMTQDPVYREPAQRALQYIIEAQNKSTGGWRYTPGEAGDTSVVGWQMMALKSGEMAGLEVPGEVHDGIRKWLKSVEGNQPVGGRFGYTNQNATPAMSAEGLLCLQFLGTSRNDPAMRAGADYLLTQLPEIRQANTSYYWYYGTQVMYHMQGDYWQEWNAALRDMIVETQIKDGHMAGTWNPTDNWEKSGGRLYSTCMKLLLLEIYYRHLPLYEQLDD